MKKTFLDWVKNPNKSNVKKFKVIEYCTGDFGDKGTEIGFIYATSKEQAKELYKGLNRIKDSEIGFYGFSEIK